MRAPNSEALAQHHLEAVVVRRVVGAGDLQAAVGVEVMDREIEHRRRPAADPEHVDAAGAKAVAERLGELGRAEAAVEAEAGPPAAGGAKHRRVGPAQRPRVGREQRLPTMPRMSYSRSTVGWNRARPVAGADSAHALFLCG